jgi:hypothetical protein
MKLDPEDHRAIAQNVVEMLRGDVAAVASRATDPDPLFNREQAAAYCTLTVRTFDRERKRLPDALKPAATAGPLAHRWRKTTLDLYKLTQGAPIHHKRGPKPKHSLGGIAA